MQEWWNGGILEWGLTTVYLYKWTNWACALEIDVGTARLPCKLKECIKRSLRMCCCITHSYSYLTDKLFSAVGASGFSGNGRKRKRKRTRKRTRKRKRKWKWSSRRLQMWYRSTTLSVLLVQRLVTGSRQAAHSSYIISWANIR